MEIIVDAYGPEEQAMGWYYYLEEKLKFPFTAVCSMKRSISPLQIKDEVDVLGMAPEEECEKENVRYDPMGKGRLGRAAVPTHPHQIHAQPNQTSCRGLALLGANGVGIRVVSRPTWGSRQAPPWAR